MERKPHILLVDDQADFLAPITFWLRSKGYEVTTAASGAQAIELIKDRAFDMVFLDVRMPQMNGLETLRQIRTFNTTLPVVILTAHYQEEYEFCRERDLGVSGFFLKESSLEKLGWVLESILRMGGTSSAPDVTGPPAGS